MGHVPPDHSPQPRKPPTLDGPRAGRGWLSVPAAEPKGTLRVAAKADMATLDPANAIDYQSWVVVEQMFNGLYNFDKDGRTCPIWRRPCHASARTA